MISFYCTCILFHYFDKNDKCEVIYKMFHISHRYREITGSLRNCLNCVHNCDDHGLLNDKCVSE